jgi:hypothetical protein
VLPPTSAPYSGKIGIQSLLKGALLSQVSQEVSWRLLRGLIIGLDRAYSSCKMKPADYRINSGGLAVGIGIGYEI